MAKVYPTTASYEHLFEMVKDASLIEMMEVRDF